MIRPYRPEDKEALLEVFRLNTPKYFDPAEEHEFTEYLEIKSDTYLVVEQENRIVGSVGYEVRESDSSGRINWIFMHPDYSGTGLGKKAVEHCLNILNADPGVELLVVRTSQLAYTFFERLGYQVVEIQKDYWAKGLDLYLMEREVERK